MTPLKQQISLIQFSIEHWYSPYKRRRFENRWDQTFCILLIKDVLSVIKSANLCRRQNLKQKKSGFEFGFSDHHHIFGCHLDLDVHRISVPKLWIHSSASFISPSWVQIGWWFTWLYENWENRNANKCRKIAYSSCSGEEHEKPESTRRSASPPKVNHF